MVTTLTVEIIPILSIHIAVRYIKGNSMKKRIAILIIFALSLIAMTALAAPLPASDWYAVIYQQDTDTLHWVNAAGEQASVQRPQIPNETEYLGLRISPDGRYMAMRSMLISNQEALGVYDFNAGTFIAVHLAQNSEQINLGYQNIFSPDSQRFAVGFFSGDFQNPAWRMILFDSATGAAVAFIDNTHPQAPDSNLAAPTVKYFDGTRVHFHLIPQGVGGAMTWPAYQWYVGPFDANIPLLSESPYDAAEMDIRIDTGEGVLAYENPQAPTLAPIGPAPSLNAIGRISPEINDTPLPLHIDSTRYHFQARWVKGGEWVIFYSTDQAENGYLSNILADGTPGNNSYLPFDPQFRTAYGTSDGYLIVNNANQVYYTNGFSSATAPLVFTGQGNIQVVYVTPIGATFALDDLAGGGLVGPGDLVAPGGGSSCPGAPPQRVAIGDHARVTFTNGTALNVRQNPGGTIVAIFPEGTEFDVIGGPQCQSNFSWWRIQGQLEGTTFVGWVAEGDFDDYYLEPFANGGVQNPGGLVAPPTPIPTLGGFAVVPTPQPTIGGFVLVPTPQPTIGGFVFVPVVDGDCSLAPQRRITVGMNPRTSTNGGTLAMRTNVTDELPSHQVPDNLTTRVIDGPACHRGYRFWQIQVVLNGQLTTGWVSEGTQQRYFLAP
jgi:hypothetical protein